MTGAGPGLEKLKMPGSEFFLLPGPGRNLNFFYCRGRNFFYYRDRAGIYIFLLTGPKLNRDQKFLNDRGRAGTGKIENNGAGPESEFFLLPWPGRDLIFL